MLQLMRIQPAPDGDEGVRVIVVRQDDTTETWKALAVEIVLDTTPVTTTGTNTQENP